MMTNKALEKIRVGLMLLTSVLLVAAGVALAVSAVRLYRTGGEYPFEPARVREAFSRVAPLVWVALFALLADVVYAIVCPPERARVRAWRESRDLLARNEARVGKALAADEVLCRERARRRVLFLIWSAVSAVSAVVALVLLLIPSRYGEDYNASVIGVVTWLLPVALVVAALTLLYGHFADASRARSMARIKELLATGAVSAQNVTSGETGAKNSARGVAVARVAVAVIAVALIVAGLVNGGLVDVLAKAIAICTECIGLG